MATPTVTLENVRDTQFDILREDQLDSSAYPPALMDSFTNIGQKQFCTGRIIHPLTKEDAKKGSLPFLNYEAFYTFVDNTTLTAAASAGDLSLTVGDTTNWPTTGRIYIQGEMVSYSAKASATEFTLSTALRGNYSSGTRVDIAFALPSDYQSPIGLILNHKGKVKARKYDDIFEYLNSYKGTVRGRMNRAYTAYDDPYVTPPFYAIKDAADLCLFNIGQTNDQLLLRYEKKPTTMTADSDLITIDDDDYGKLFLAYQGLGQMFWHRQEEASASNYLNVALSLAREMYEMYNRQDMEKMSGKQVSMPKGTGHNF